MVGDIDEVIAKADDLAKQLPRMMPWLLTFIMRTNNLLVRRPFLFRWAWQIRTTSRTLVCACDRIKQTQYNSEYVLDHNNDHHLKIARNATICMYEGGKKLNEYSPTARWSYLQLQEGHILSIVSSVKHVEVDMSPWFTCGNDVLHVIWLNEFFFSATRHTVGRAEPCECESINKGWRSVFSILFALYMWVCFVCNPSWPDRYSYGTTKLNTHAQCLGVPIFIDTFFVHE